jgi:hypothetical protein
MIFQKYLFNFPSGMKNASCWKVYIHEEFGMFIKTLLNLSFAFLSVISISSALAGPITVTFDDVPAGWAPSNIVVDGMMFSPSSHYDLLATTAFQPARNHWIGFDESPSFKNSDYLAPSGFGAGMYVTTAEGEQFDLLALTFVSNYPDYGWYQLESSNGGIAEISYMNGEYVTYNFSGPEWTNLNWLMFHGGGGAPQGFDDLTVNVHSVDEPMPLTMFLLSGLIIAGMRMSKRKAPRHR